MALRVGQLDTRLTQASVDPRESATQTASLIGTAVFAGLPGVPSTHTHTYHATCDTGKKRAATTDNRYVLLRCKLNVLGVHLSTGVFLLCN